MRLNSASSGIVWLILAGIVVAGMILLRQPSLEQDPNKVWAKAQEDLKADRISEAEAGLERLHQLRKPTSEDEMLAAQVALARHHEADAIAILERMPDTDRLAPVARLLQGQVELRRNRVAFAERALRTAVRLNPKLAQAHSELIVIYGMQLRRRELNAEFAALSELKPLTFQNLWHWVLTRNNKWEPLELSKTLKEYLNADPSDRWSRVGLAECLRQLGRRTEAESVLAALPDSDPDACVLRAQLALDRSDDREAEEILKRGPDHHAELARLRGRFALSHGDGEEALRQFKIADKADPGNRDSVFGILGALKLLGRDDEAAPYVILSRKLDKLGSLLQRASAESGERDPQLPKQFAAACESLDRLLEARAWYQLAITRNPLDTEAQQGIFRIKGKLAKENPNPSTDAQRPDDRAR